MGTHAVGQATRLAPLSMSHSEQTGLFLGILKRQVLKQREFQTEGKYIDIKTDRGRGNNVFKKKNQSM